MVRKALTWLLGLFRRAATSPPQNPPLALGGPVSHDETRAADWERFKSRDRDRFERTLKRRAARRRQ